MPPGKAQGPNRDYQVLCRDFLQHRIGGLLPYAGDGVDVPILLGTTTRVIDIALVSGNGGAVLAECKRTMKPVELAELDAFAYRVELFRRDYSAKAAGILFAKTGLQRGVIKAAADAHVQLAVCAEGQSVQNFTLVFFEYDVQNERRLAKPEHFASGAIRPIGTLSAKVIRADGTEDDLGKLT